MNVWDDLEERLQSADLQLHDLQEKALEEERFEEVVRLQGKREGLSLSYDYIRYARRNAEFQERLIDEARRVPPLADS